MNLANIGYCRKCNSAYFSSGSQFGDYCCRDCQDADYIAIELEERIAVLENKLILSEERITGLEQKLQLCLNKLGIADL